MYTGEVRSGDEKSIIDDMSINREHRKEVLDTRKHNKAQDTTKQQPETTRSDKTYNLAKKEVVDRYKEKLETAA